MKENAKVSRKLSLSDQGVKIAFLMLNNGQNGNSLKELKMIDSAMDDIETACGTDEKSGEKFFRAMDLYITEGVYNLLKSRFEQSKNWGGTGRKAVLAFEDSLDNAEKVNGKPEPVATPEPVAPGVDANVPELTEPGKTE